jgi:hypothetical protein
MKPILFCLLFLTSLSCNPPPEIATAKPVQLPSPTPPKPAKNPAIKTIHVVVALCDNQSQGIVPVPARIGNGDDPANNLYWGAAFGVKSFFQRAKEWTRLATQPNPKPLVLERLVFKHKTKDVFLIADAYRGRAIKQSLVDFFDFAAGHQAERLNLHATHIDAGGKADLLAYIGHDGLMEFSVDKVAARADHLDREAIMLACISKNYFAEPLRATGAKPLLWTTGLMAPEAYILKAAVDGWLAKESDQQIRARAAAAYHQYQRCGIKAAQRLFATGW